MNDFILKARILNFMKFFKLSTKYRDKSLKKFYITVVLFYLKYINNSTAKKIDERIVSMSTKIVQTASLLTVYLSQ